MALLRALQALSGGSATGLVAEASERRSHHENRRRALFRLRVKLAVAVRSRPVTADSFRPDTLWTERTVGGKIACSRSHRDYPMLLATALDAVEAADLELAASARLLGVTTSQLRRWLGREPAAVAWVNERRQLAGRKPLRWQ